MVHVHSTETRARASLTGGQVFDHHPTLQGCAGDSGSKLRTSDFGSCWEAWLAPYERSPSVCVYWGKNFASYEI